MLVYDPQTNGAGWVAMRGIPSSLTEVESQSASDLGNFYPIPVHHQQARHPMGNCKSNTHKPEPSHLNPRWETLTNIVDWDTDDVQDRSRTPSPVTIIDEPTQGAAEEIPPALQNRHLVPERILKTNVELHQEHVPDKKEKETQEHTPRKEQSAPAAEEDVVVLYAGTEEL